MIEFGQLLADLPTLKNGGATKVDNVIPLAKGYKSIPSFTALSSTGLTGTPVDYLQVFLLQEQQTMQVMMVKLYQMDSNLVFQDKSKAVGITDQQQQVVEIFGALHNLVQTFLQQMVQTIYKKFEEGTDTAFSDRVTLKSKIFSNYKRFCFCRLHNGIKCCL